MATVYTIMQMSGAGNSLKELNGAGIHRLENVMTLYQGLHNRMDNLQLWFEEVEGKVCCTVLLWNSCSLSYYRRTAIAYG